MKGRKGCKGVFELPEPRFWAGIAITDGCWEWTKGPHAFGYGRISVNGKEMPAHRYSWELHNGLIPEGMLVCHHCDNKKCCRPDHLFLGTQSDNMRDMVSKGRNVAKAHPELLLRGAQHPSTRRPECLSRGESHPISKLTEAQVREIFERVTHGATKLGLAKEFGIARAQIQRIAAKKAWRHVVDADFAAVLGMAVLDDSEEVLSDG